MSYFPANLPGKPTGVVTTFLEANGVAFATAQNRKAMATEDIGDQAKRFTFKIDCH